MAVFFIILVCVDYGWPSTCVCFIKTFKAGFIR